MKALSCSLMLHLLLLCNAVSAADNAYIKMELDSSEVFSGDVIVLDIESTGLVDPIDFSLIEQNAEILRETTGDRIFVVNGKVQKITIRRMTLLPKRTGVLVIGPLTAGETVSNTVHIKILDATRPDWTPESDDAQINISLTPENIFVNQQLLLSIELLHRYPINSESVELPDLNGFSKRTLIENRRTHTDGDKKWFRTVWQYLVYPRQSGSIEIDPVSWRGTLAKSNIERTSFSRKSSSLRVDIKPAPGDSSAWWLPADSIVLTESWSSPPTELRAGDELERTITIQATNVLAGQIPTPSVPESRALKQTLINSSREETLTKSGVHSRAEFTYRVNAQSPIPVFLDTVRIPWWDTTTQTSREAIIPARRINVGLPDRADLLSKLALEESGMNRLKHQLQSTGMIRLLSYAAALIASVAVLCFLLPSAIRTSRQRLRLQSHFRELNRVARRDGSQALYKSLQSSDSKQLLQGAEKPLIKQLESTLFNRSNAHRKNLSTDDLLKQLKQQLVLQAEQKNNFQQKPESHGLAEL